MALKGGDGQENVGHLHLNHQHLNHPLQSNNFENLIEAIRCLPQTQVVQPLESVHQFGDCLTLFYPMWQSITSDKWMLEIVKQWILNSVCILPSYLPCLPILLQ